MNQMFFLLFADVETAARDFELLGDDDDEAAVFFPLSCL